MDITFVGTGTVSSKSRNNMGILVDDILLDCGMGIIKKLEEYGKRSKDIKYLLITHFHADHFFDILNLLYGRLSRKECDEKLHIILPTNGRMKIIDLVKFGFGKEYEDIEEKFNIEFIELDINETYNCEDYQIIPIQVKHGDCIPAYGYLLKKGNITIGYSGDTQICDNFLKMCEQSNYMFAEATIPVSSNKGGHISFEELKVIAEKYNNCKFYAVHRGDYEITSKGKVFVPNDGDTLQI